MNTKRRLRGKILRITLFPLILLTITITIFIYYSFSTTMQKEVHRGLKNVASTTLHMYDMLYEGDYNAIKTEDGIVFFKGDADLTQSVEMLNQIKADTGIDITFFFYDLRALTTLQGADNSSLIGTVAHPNVVNDVLTLKKETFYESVRVADKDYFAYYAPLFDDAGVCMGMIFAGKPTDVVHEEIWDALSPIIYIVLGVVAITCVLCNSFARELVMVIHRIKSFLRDISHGNLKTELDSRIIQRKDELGEMGRFTVHLQRSLREMIERDALTKLYNRRSGELKLKQSQMNALETGVKFSVVLGDIDFFKKFNDHYGHDCGDLVLVEIAKIFNSEMIGKGYAVRWGGEEFLIVYENKTMQEAYEQLRLLREKVLELDLEYQEELLKVTMTFGITQGSTTKELKDIIKRADELLYEGKMNGRNQIVIDTLYEDEV